MDKNFSIDNDFLANVFYELLFPVILVDDDVGIVLTNAAAKKLVPSEVNPYMKRAGEALQCINAQEKGCGKSEFCKECVIRGAVKTAFSEDKVVLFRRTHQKLIRDGKTVMANLLVTATPIKRGLEKLVILVIQDINDLIHLSRLMPMCANCKKIRDEKGSWENVEKYIEDRVDVDFSHGVCPSCMKKLYGNTGQ